MNGQTVPILMYHSIAPTWPETFGRWTVAPALFSSHLDALAAANYTPLTLSAAVGAVRAGRSLPPRTVILTFDDGFADFLSNALPLLEEHGFPATLFVTTGYLGGTSRWLESTAAGWIPMMSLDQLGALGDRGVEVGAHSRSHAMLDLLRESQLAAEIHEPRDLLREASGQEVTSFAYPHGYSSRAVRRSVADAGFDSAVSVHHSLSGSFAERFEIPRLIIEGEQTADEVIAAMHGTGLRSQRGRHAQEHLWRLRRKAWTSTQRRLATSVGER